MQLLGCLPPSLEPRTTEHIGAMISTIERIIEHGHGYAVEGGDVFFDVASLPGYGRLSGRQQVGPPLRATPPSCRREDWRIAAGT